MNQIQVEETIIELTRFIPLTDVRLVDRVLVWSNGDLSGPEPSFDQHGLRVVAEFKRSLGPFSHDQIRARIVAGIGL